MYLQPKRCLVVLDGAWWVQPEIDFFLLHLLISSDIRYQSWKPFWGDTTWRSCSHATRYVTFIPHSFRPHSAVSRFTEKGIFSYVNPSFFLLQSTLSTENHRLSCLTKPGTYIGKNLFHTKRNVSSTLVKWTAHILIGLQHLVKNKKILKEICRNSQGKFDSDRPWYNGDYYLIHIHIRFREPACGTPIYRFVSSTSISLPWTLIFILTTVVLFHGMNINDQAESYCLSGVKRVITLTVIARSEWGISHLAFGIQRRGASVRLEAWS